MLYITLNRKKYCLETHQPSNMLVDFGTYGNGSIDWKPEGLHLYEMIEQLNMNQPLAAEINGLLLPMDTFITQDCKIKFITAETAVGRKILKNTGIFLLAYAVKTVTGNQLQRLKGSMLSATTFCYDFITANMNSSANYTITHEMLDEIQLCLNAVLSSSAIIRKKAVPYYQMKKKLREWNEPYLIQQIDINDDGGPVKTYQLDEFIEPCDAFLLKNLDRIKNVRIIDVENGLTRCRVSAEILAK